MPVEVLTREEVERIVEEKIRKLLTESVPASQGVDETRVEIAKLKAQIAEMSGRISDLAARPAAGAVPAPPIEDILRSELGGLAELLEIRSQPDQLTLRPRRYLGSQDFRSVSEVLRRHGGFWSSMNRFFIIRKARR